MSTPTTLNELIAPVPVCVQSMPLAAAVDIFSQGQSDRIVVVNEQQCPIAGLSLRRLMPLLLRANEGANLERQQPMWIIAQACADPLTTIPAAWSLEQFDCYIRSQAVQTQIGGDWVLVDAEGKCLGLLDIPRLLRLLALFPAGASATDWSEPTELPTTANAEHSLAPGLLNSLVRLLEQLPWPLLLQTSSGEVVMQNSAWWQHFGTFDEPETVRREVEAILENAFAPTSGQNSPSGLLLSGNRQFATPSSPTTHFSPATQTCNSPRECDSSHQRQKFAITPEETLREHNSPLMHDSPLVPVAHSSHLSTPSLSVLEESQLSEINYCPLPEADSVTIAAGRCQLSTQPGACICVWPTLNGQDRVWKFVKIPLQEVGVKSQKLEKLSLSSSATEVSPDLWLLLATDVTEQQQLASELVAKNADLIQLNRLKDEFLACISHELRTPLTAVLGLSTLLKDQALGQLNDRQARYARLIHENGRHLMTVVNDILDLTRMETGQMELTLEPVKIATVCDRAIEQAKAIHSKTTQSYAEEQLETANSHRLTILIEPGIEEIVADELRLRQMLIHLLSNAFKFTEAGGEIGLRVSYWEGWIAFTVWDTGIGIPEPKQHLIFQKFQQLENPLTRQFEGTGLGLVLTRALARLHGGDVSFISKEGKGSQFTLLLPPHPPQKGTSQSRQSRLDRLDGEAADNWQSAAQSAGSSQSAVAARKLPVNLRRQRLRDRHRQLTPPSRRNRLVLVVEAAPKFIEDLTERLTSLGYSVAIARSGTEAIEKARRLQPGAVFLNPLLPLLSGWDVLTLLKTDITTSQIPAIVTSTSAEKDKAFSHRADEFLNLPVQAQSLQQVLTCFCPQPLASQLNENVERDARGARAITTLRLVNPQALLLASGAPSTPATAGESLNLHSSTFNHRVLEADDLEQAELLARVWQPDVVLMEQAMPEPLAYLQQLSQYPTLATLPLVTLDAATTQAANLVSGLSVFPCLARTPELTVDALLSVLEIAAGMSWEHSILVVDFAQLLDLAARSCPDDSNKPAAERVATAINPTLRKQLFSTGEQPFTSTRSSSSLGSEWFQALIQYLHTAGFRGAIAHSWAEVLQQIRQQSVDLLLLCLGESNLHSDVFAALKALSQQDDLPPVLVLDQHLSPTEEREYHPTTQQQSAASAAVEAIETMLTAIAAQVLPDGLSMEELLDRIHQTLR